MVGSFQKSQKEAKMKKSVFGTTMVATMAFVLALALLTVPAAASAPADVTILSEMVLPPDAAPYGTFVASGPAVDAGILCPAGDVFDVETRAAGYQSGRLVMLFVHKHFVCTDGSGSFEMNLNVQGAPAWPRGTTAEWRVVAGDGDYAGLQGEGTPTADVAPGMVTDHYTGRLHIN
jgi:hypothetical protein